MQKARKAAGKVRLDDLLGTRQPQEIFTEVQTTTRLFLPDLDFVRLNQTFSDILKLFQGEFPGYRRCNTFYHDLDHTMDCFLAMGRLLHGVSLHGVPLGERHVELGLISSLMHDTGYIQHVEERHGSGGQYTLYHIERSIDFMEHYFTENGFSREDFRLCRNSLKCTGLNVHIREIRFASRENEIVGKALGTADLLGQMADAAYLEKLPFLYQEFFEGGIPDFLDELDLLKKTPGFWDFTKKRMAEELGDLEAYCRDHFKARWGIDRDLYNEAVEENISYLKFILQNYESDYRNYLNRQTMKHYNHTLSLSEQL